MKIRTTLVTLTIVATFILCHNVLWAQENSLSNTKARRIAPAPQNKSQQARDQQRRGRRDQPDPQKRRGGGPLMGLLDADKDRSLSVTELQNATKRLKAFDTNKDGKWSAEELEQAHQKLKGVQGNRERDQRPGQKRGERQEQKPNNQRVTRPSHSSQKQ